MPSGPLQDVQMFRWLSTTPIRTAKRGKGKFRALPERGNGQYHTNKYRSSVEREHCLLNCNSFDCTPSTVPVTRRFLLGKRTLRSRPSMPNRAGVCANTLDIKILAFPILLVTADLGARPRTVCGFIMPKEEAFSAVKAGRSCRPVCASRLPSMSLSAALCSLRVARSRGGLGAKLAPTCWRIALMCAMSLVTSRPSLRTVRFPGPASRPNPHRLVEIRHPERQ